MKANNSVRTTNAHKIAGSDIWIVVPEWANWIAIDKSGAVFAYENEPRISTMPFVDSWTNTGVDETPDREDRFRLVRHIDFEPGDPDWKETLQKL